MSLAEAVAQLARHNITGAPVLHAGRVIGVASLTDLMREAPDRQSGAMLGDTKGRSGSLRVKDVMTTRVVSLPPTATVAEVADLMQREHVHRVLVMEGELLYGIVSTFDVARAVAATPSVRPSSELFSAGAA
jgi:CBS domain-containing protein